jgi:hypothetical protein
MATEITPLTGQVASQFASNLLSKENLEAASASAKQKWEQISKSAQEGNISLQVLALIAGVALTITAGFGLFGKALSIQLFKAVLEFYSLLLGIVIILLESPQLKLPDTWTTSIYHYALFLKYVWGRGILYFVAGTLHLAQSSGLFDLLTIAVGGYVAGVGVIFILVGYNTSGRLNDVHASIKNESTLRSKFNAATKDGNNTLSLAQFQAFTNSLGVPLSKPEAQIAFSHLDTNQNGSISYEEVKLWWNEWAPTASKSGESSSNPFQSILQATVV